MDGYINEAEAQIEVENAIREIRSDYKLYVYQRKAKGAHKKTTTFVLIVTQEQNNEDIFDALMKASSKSGGALQVVSATAQLNETKRIIEDVFRIDAEITIAC